MRKKVTLIEVREWIKSELKSKDCSNVDDLKITIIRHFHEPDTTGCNWNVEGYTEFIGNKSELDQAITKAKVKFNLIDED